jgi:hypothetical protein
VISIEKYLELSMFHFNNNLWLSLDKKVLKFDSIIEQNKYDSFLIYNKKNITNNIDNIIFSMAYLYKENFL